MKEIIKKTIDSIKQIACDFFSAFFENFHSDFDFVEPTITQEDVEELMQIIKEWEERKGLSYE